MPTQVITQSAKRPLAQETLTQAPPQVLAGYKIHFAEGHLRGDALVELEEYVTKHGGQIVSDRMAATQVIIHPGCPSMSGEAARIAASGPSDRPHPPCVPYHWLSQINIISTLIPPSELEPPLPIFYHPSSAPPILNKPLKVYVSVNVSRNAGEIEAEQAHRAVIAMLCKGGAMISKKRGKADLLIVDKTSNFYQTVRDEMIKHGRTHQRLAERDWVEDCMANGKVAWSNTWLGQKEDEDSKDAGNGNESMEEGMRDTGNRKASTGRVASRNEFTEAEDDFMCRWLAREHRGLNTASRKTYTELVNSAYPLAKNHTMESWLNRFKKNSIPLGRRIQRFLQAGLDEGLTTKDERDKKRALEEQKTKGQEKDKQQERAAKALEEVQRAMQWAVAAQETRSTKASAAATTATDVTGQVANAVASSSQIITTAPTSTVTEPAPAATSEGQSAAADTAPRSRQLVTLDESSLESESSRAKAAEARPSEVVQENADQAKAFEPTITTANSEETPRPVVSIDANPLTEPAQPAAAANLASTTAPERQASSTITAAHEVIAADPVNVDAARTTTTAAPPSVRPIEPATAVHVAATDAPAPPSHQQSASTTEPVPEPVVPIPQPSPQAEAKISSTQLLISETQAFISESRLSWKAKRKVDEASANPQESGAIPGDAALQAVEQVPERDGKRVRTGGEVSLETADGAGKELRAEEAQVTATHSEAVQPVAASLTAPLTQTTVPASPAPIPVPVVSTTAPPATGTPALATPIAAAAVASPRPHSRDLPPPQRSAMRRPQSSAPVTSRANANADLGPSTPNHAGPSGGRGPSASTGVQSRRLPNGKTRISIPLNLTFRETVTPSRSLPPAVQRVQIDSPATKAGFYDVNEPMTRPRGARESPVLDIVRRSRASASPGMSSSSKGDRRRSLLNVRRRVSGYVEVDEDDGDTVYASPNLPPPIQITGNTDDSVNGDGQNGAGHANSLSTGRSILADFAPLGGLPPTSTLARNIQRRESGIELPSRPAPKNRAEREESVRRGAEVVRNNMLEYRENLTRLAGKYRVPPREVGEVMRELSKGGKRGWIELEERLDVHYRLAA